MSSFDITSEASQEEHLEDILHKYLTMQERFSEDRQEFAKQIGELGKVVVRFSAQISKFNEASTQFHEVGQKMISQVNPSIQNAMKTMVKETVDGFRSGVIDTVGEASHRLLGAVGRATQELEEEKKAQRINQWLFMLTMFLASMTLGLFIVWYFMPAPVSPLTNAQMNTYQAGQFLQSVWPKLSKKDQQHLEDLAKANGINNPA